MGDEASTSNGQIFDEDIQDFDVIRKKDGFVDHTDLNKLFFGSVPKKLSIFAPSHFCKSTNLMMMEYFYKIKDNGKVEDNLEDRCSYDIFKELKIFDCRDTEKVEEWTQVLKDHFCAHPVLYADFGITHLTSYEEAISHCFTVTQCAYNRNRSFLENNLKDVGSRNICQMWWDSKLDELDKVYGGDRTTVVEKGLQNLCQYLYNSCNQEQRVLVLIDEADAVVSAALTTILKADDASSNRYLPKDTVIAIAGLMQEMLGNITKDIGTQLEKKVQGVLLSGISFLKGMGWSKKIKAKPHRFLDDSTDALYGDTTIPMYGLTDYQLDKLLLNLKNKGHLKWDTDVLKDIISEFNHDQLKDVLSWLKEEKHLKWDTYQLEDLLSKLKDKQQNQLEDFLLKLKGEGCLEWFTYKIAKLIIDDEYNGYLTSPGNIRIYSLWSVLHFLQSPQSSDLHADLPLIVDCYRKAFVSTLVGENVLQLLAGKEVVIEYLKKIELEQLVKLRDVEEESITHRNILFSLLMDVGFLTNSEQGMARHRDKLKVKFPNGEVRKVFTSMLKVHQVQVGKFKLDLQQQCAREVIGLKTSVCIGDAEQFKKHLRILYDKLSSLFEFFNLKYLSEEHLQVVVTMSMHNSGFEIVEPKYYSKEDKGYPDLWMKDDDCTYIWELKVRKGVEVEKTSMWAMKEIHGNKDTTKKGYLELAKENVNYILVGLSINGQGKPSICVQVEPPLPANMGEKGIFVSETEHEIKTFQTLYQGWYDLLEEKIVQAPTD